MLNVALNGCTRLLVAHAARRRHASNVNTGGVHMNREEAAAREAWKAGPAGDGAEDGTAAEGVISGELADVRAEVRSLAAAWDSGVQPSDWQQVLQQPTTYEAHRRWRKGQPRCCNSAQREYSLAVDRAGQRTCACLMQARMPRRSQLLRRHIIYSMQLK